ncbi:hypothetical protein MVEN_02367300 [Mycena venus]|uniref:Uncharacterized protein n=1 Tax=Mycena venus TaxID=2733690 RepID=A0A8H6X3T9_9AGAR|nr:hypothetical protein MVEN_02367300 [Mycena venus]
MPNPVDDAPLGHGEIALPVDSEPSNAQSNFSALNCLKKYRRRIFYGVVAVCCILALVAFTVGRRFRHPTDDLPHDAPLTDIADDARLEPYQTPENAAYCADWAPGPDDSVSASFELPAKADLLFFLSRGPVFGHISIIKTPEWSNGPVEVNITAQYHTREDLAQTKVCRMGASQEHGVLLWAEPRHPHDDPRQDVRINITVALPTAASLRDYKDLTTDLPLFSHSCDDFFDFWSPTSFEVIRLKTSNAPIHYGGLVGRAGFIQTSNADVRGFFGGYEVMVQTSNAPIEAIAFMFGESPGSESRVQFKTSNGVINASLVLISDFDDNILRATLRTSNAALVVQTPRQGIMSPNSSFFLDASTSVGPATLYLYPEYEGPYELRTTVARARVEETTEDIGDPAGKGRHRTVTKTGTSHHVQGNVYWSHDGKPTPGFERGSVKIITSVSPVELYV